MEDLLNKIKSAINYYDFFSKYLKLKKVGSGYMALCPFHADSNPSLSVDIERGLWYCFGCNKGGDVFNFIMEMENCSFWESLKILCEELGISCTQEYESKYKSKGFLHEVNFEIYQIVMEFYHRILKKTSISEKARQYLAERKIKEDVIEAYKLGYASKNIENLKTFCNKKGISLEELEKAGLVYRKGKEFFEILAGRIVIPIFSPSGKILGFSGRSIDNSDPKYINTIGLKKTETLYGINVAKEYIRSRKSVIWVEGYFDVWALFSIGIKNTVAIMGTAVSQTQLQIIKKYADEVILFLDSDKSGKEAIINMLINLVANDLIVKICSLEKYKDPHEMFIYDPEVLEKVIETPKKDIKYLIDYYVNQPDVYKKQEILEKYVFPFFASIKKKLIKQEYVKNFSLETGVNYGYIVKNVKRFKTKEPLELNEEQVIKKYGLEVYLLVFGLFNFDILKKYLFSFNPVWFEQKEISSKLFKYLVEKAKTNTEPREYIIYELGLNEICGLVAKINLQIEPQQKEEYFKRIIQILEKKYLILDLKDSIKKEDYEKVKEIQRKFKKI